MIYFILIVLAAGFFACPAFAAPLDSDNDGVPDAADACPAGTRLKELIPTDSLGTNRYALTNGDRIFDTTTPKGRDPAKLYTVDGSAGSSTCGCSCEQILAQSPGEKKGLFKFGCTAGILDEFIQSRCPVQAVDSDNDGYTVPGGDCNDSDPAIHPGAPETCNGLDDDCDGIADDGITPVPITCGEGACAGTGQRACVNGQLQSQCTPAPAGTPCRASTGPCDLPESCDESGSCPADLNAPEGTACDDSNACTVKDACIAGTCTGIPATCEDGNPCTADSCDPATGCMNRPRLDGTECDDSNACTMQDACNAGTCAGLPVTCDDGNPCTADNCDTATGCTTRDLQDGTNCIDNNACTIQDTCITGTCTGLPASCDDGNSCTADSCDPVTGCTVRDLQDGTECNDNNACTMQDACNAGSCTGTQNSCEDGQPCTDDSCNPILGCVHIPKNCDDGIYCTTESCNALTGECIATPHHDYCDDGYYSTGDFCIPSEGGCQNIWSPEEQVPQDQPPSQGDEDYQE